MTQTRNPQTTGAGASSPESGSDLLFADLPPFPTEIDTAPLLRIKLSKLLQGDEVESDRLWQACQDLGFFYLQLNEDDEAGQDGTRSKDNGSDVDNRTGEVTCMSSSFPVFLCDIKL